MIARYSSKCRGCKKSIVAGSPIAMVKGRAMHVRCAPAPKTAPAKALPVRRNDPPREDDIIDRI